MAWMCNRSRCASRGRPLYPRLDLQATASSGAWNQAGTFGGTNDVNRLEVLTRPHDSNLHRRAGLCPDPAGEGAARPAAPAGGCLARSCARRRRRKLGAVEASRSQIKAAQAQLKPPKARFSGVREEAKVGQRTTLDVLNAQQEVFDATVNLIISQRDRVWSRPTTFSPRSVASMPA